MEHNRTGETKIIIIIVILFAINHMCTAIKERTVSKTTRLSRALTVAFN